MTIATQTLLDLTELAQSQWVSLNPFASALAVALDQPVDVTKRVLSAYSIEAVRPARASFSDGAGISLNGSNDNPSDTALFTCLVSHRLKHRDEQRQANDDVQRISEGCTVDFTIPALRQWLISCSLSDEAQRLFGQWMGNTYPVLVKHNLLVGSTTAQADNQHEYDNTSLDLILSHNELINLTGKRRGFAQHRILQSMRIPSRLRDDGKVIVLRGDLSELGKSRSVKPKAQPNFDALD